LRTGEKECEKGSSSNERIDDEMENELRDSKDRKSGLADLKNREQFIRDDFEELKCFCLVRTF
jgi:hypothetical protein